MRRIKNNYQLSQELKHHAFETLIIAAMQSQDERAKSLTWMFPELYNKLKKMNKKMTQNQKILIDELDVYSDYDREDYQKLEFERIGVVTQQGLPDQGAALIDGKWIPKSQLKCDVDGDLYVRRWWYNKNMG